MKIVHIWKSPGIRGGGGGVMMGRLHKELLRHGIDSWVLAEEEDPPAQVHRLPKWRYVDGPLLLLFRELGLNDVHRISSFNLKNHRLVKSADVVHIHGTHSGVFNYLALPNLTRYKPTVFTLHDMWLLTGHCAFSYDCQRWQTGCGNCPYPDEPPRIRRDATAVEWRMKRASLTRSKIRLLPASTWLDGLLARSSLSTIPRQVIPYPVDPAFLKPIDRVSARSHLGIREEETVIMTSAVDVESHRKGFDLLVESLPFLLPTVSGPVCLMTMGRMNREARIEGVRLLPLGQVDDDATKVSAYTAADVFVHPSRADNLPLVIQEAMACSTPVVAFDVGGIGDLVRHRLTGYLASPLDASDLARGVSWALADGRRATLGRNGRDRIERLFSPDVVTRQYIRTYESVSSHLK